MPQVWRKDKLFYLIVQQLFQHLSESVDNDPVERFNGEIQVRNGGAVNAYEFTVLHNRSVAEGVTYWRDEELFSGEVPVTDGVIADTSISVRGRSLIHSVELTTKAFNRGLLGDYGQYIVSIGLVLFAFSTAVAWSYYGDRAITYLFGLKLVLPYRVLYVFGFFMASISDTSLIWLISAITVAFMALPNLFGILMLHREMKETVKDYWIKFRNERPEGV